MTKGAKIFFISALLAFAILTTTCSKERYLLKVTWEGHLYDSAGGKPVAGYWITLYACDPMDGHNQCGTFKVGQAQTDASGYFKIHDNAARSDRYFVQWSTHAITDRSGNELKKQNVLYLY